MVSIKKLFKAAFSKQKQHVRAEITHPNQLQQGDIIELSLLPQALLSKQRFMVASVSAYDFGGELSPCFTLQGAGQQDIYLSINTHNQACFSIDIPENKVKQLFSAEQFAQIFEQGTQLHLVSNNTNSFMPDWVAASYEKEIDAILGYYHEQYDSLTSKVSDSAEGFDYYRLIDTNREFAVEIEVYDGGDTEVSLTVIHPLSVIQAMWPSEQSTN